MKPEREKKVSGELYDPRDPALAAERRRARLLLVRINATRDDQREERARLARELIPDAEMTDVSAEARISLGWTRRQAGRRSKRRRWRWAELSAAW